MLLREASSELSAAYLASAFSADEPPVLLYVDGWCGRKFGRLAL